jgi:hypothetical protein
VLLGLILSRYLQSFRDHSVEQLWDIVMFDEERRTKPLRMVLEMLANPFSCPLSQRPNEGQRALWQNPDVGLSSRAVHCLRSVFASGGSVLIGNSGRKTANVCDEHARETTKNNITRLTLPGFIILLRKSPVKVPEDVPERVAASGQRRALPLNRLAENSRPLICTLQTRCSRLVLAFGVG